MREREGKTEERGERECEGKRDEKKGVREGKRDDRGERESEGTEEKRREREGGKKIEHVALIRHSGSSAADRQMARGTFSGWCRGLHIIWAPCLHFKIHQYHIDVQYTSCQEWPLSFVGGWWTTGPRPLFHMHGERGEKKVPVQSL